MYISPMQFLFSSIFISNVPLKIFRVIISSELIQRLIGRKGNASWYLKLEYLLVLTPMHIGTWNEYPALSCPLFFKESIPLLGLDWLANEGRYTPCKLHISTHCETGIPKGKCTLPYLIFMSLNKEPVHKKTHVIVKQWGSRWGMDSGNIGQGDTEEQQNKGRVTLEQNLLCCAY